MIINTKKYTIDEGIFKGFQIKKFVSNPFITYTIYSKEVCDTKESKPIVEFSIETLIASQLLESDLVESIVNMVGAKSAKFAYEMAYNKTTISASNDLDALCFLPRKLLTNPDYCKQMMESIKIHSVNTVDNILDNTKIQPFVENVQTYVDFLGDCIVIANEKAKNVSDAKTKISETIETSKENLNRIFNDREV